jgi:hypothetical protein
LKLSWNLSLKEKGLKEEAVRRRKQFEKGGSLKEEGVIKGKGGGGKGEEVKG